MFWNKKDSSINEIIRDLEIKSALDIVKRYYVNYSYYWENSTYYKFRKTWYENEIYLDKWFTVLKLLWISWDICQIIEINWNEKVKEEFSKLFEWVRLQREWMIKIKAFMVESLKEINYEKI